MGVMMQASQALLDSEEAFEEAAPSLEALFPDPWAGPYLRRETAASGDLGRRRPPAAPASPPPAAPKPAEHPAVASAAESGAASPRSLPRSRRTERSRARRLLTRLAIGVPSALGLVLLVCLALPVLFGCRSLVVLSGSMEPAVPTGAVVVVDRIPAAEVAVGDVVAFRSPEDPSRLLTHRVVAVGAKDGMVAVETRGDANSGSEKWTIDPSGTVGRMLFAVPYLGYLIAPLQGTLVRLALVVVPALLLGGMLLFDIWYPARRRPATPKPPRAAASRAARSEAM